MSNEGPVPTTYEAFERLYPELVKGTMSALQENIANTYNNTARLEEADVIHAFENAFNSNAFKLLLDKVALGLASFQSPRVNTPSNPVENKIQNQSTTAGAELEAAPWANFDLADTFRPIAQEIADLLNDQKNDENELANENKLQNRLQAKPSLTPQFKHAKKLEEKLRQVAKLAVENRLTNIPRPRPLG